MTRRSTSALEDTVPADSAGAGDPSIAGLSGDAPLPAGLATDLTGERYRELEVVGEGGLGTVLRARDQYLGRDVALKRISPRARGGAEERAHERFLREARITASLDHPNIVPIHDAGTTSDGRIFYTMRLIRGRSLTEVAAACTTLGERLGLVGALTSACHAVGHAHRRGIIHRDLKPDNIMIGELGELQVVDWGLAEELAAPTASAGFAGTLPYASPEIIDGRRPTVAADVWALGVTLHEVITGTHRFTGDRSEIQAQLAAVPLPAAVWPDGCPAELVAIGERAMARDPAARYADGHAMALDLEAFRDGRRVAAHRYSPLELARRFIVAWRWPLAAVATLVVGTISALALTAHRTEQQRVRAVVAERESRAQLGRAEDALADALAASAIAALAEHSPSRAEHAAVAALRRREHPDARGVLALVYAAPRPRLLARFVPPGCTRVAAATSDAALCLGPTTAAWWSVPSTAPRWTAPHAFAGAVALEPGWIVGWSEQGAITVLATDTGRAAATSTVLGRMIGASPAVDGSRVVLHDGRTLVAVDGDGAIRVTERPCGTTAIAAAATTADTSYVVCAAGELLALEAGESRLIAGTGFGIEIPTATALGVSEDGLDVAIGSSAGDLALRDLRGCFGPGCDDVRPTTMLAYGERTAIRTLLALGPAVIAVADRGDAVVVRRGSAGEEARVPLAATHDAVALEGGELVTGGTAWSRWQLTDQPPGALRHFRALVAATISSDGTTIAALTEDGYLLTWTVRDGTRRLVVPVSGGHAIALVAGGTEVEVHSTTAVTRYDLATGDLLERRDRPADSPPNTAPHAQTPDGRVTAEATQTTVTIGGAAGSSRTVEVVDTTVTSLGLAADGAWLAIGTSRGRIDVWSLREPAPVLRARIPSHTERVTWIAIVGDRLWSAGADGVVRQAHLPVLEATVPSLQVAADATWGPSTYPDRAR